MSEQSNHHIENQKHYKGLKVNKGVKEMPKTNPYKNKLKRKKELTVSDYMEGILKGDLSILSRAITLIESSLPKHQQIAQEVIEKSLPYSGQSVRLGITGIPGAGKSTLIETLGLYLANQGNKLAVLAIDPSSERSKGSILGDKTRMEELSVHENAFIRPSPTSGTLGGVARKSRESIILCEAAGFDTIFVETVGVGQSEIAVHSLVDFFLLIQLSGGGDELQGIKRGIMEMADMIVINKADGNNIEKANITGQYLQNALHMFPKTKSGWVPKVMTCSATENINIDVIWKRVMEYCDYVKSNKYFYQHRNEQSKYWLFQTINEQLQSDFYNNPIIKKQLKEVQDKVFNNDITSFVAAKEILKTYHQLNN